MSGILEAVAAMGTGLIHVFLAVLAFTVFIGGHDECELGSREFEQGVNKSVNQISQLRINKVH